jgi:hypothetical protein
MSPLHPWLCVPPTPDEMERAMPAYWVNTYRSVSDPEKQAAYAGDRI